MAQERRSEDNQITDIVKDYSVNEADSDSVHNCINGYTNLSTVMGRKASTCSTDSSDSDGQLCTEDHCIMDGKRRIRHSSSTNSQLTEPDGDSDDSSSQNLRHRQVQDGDRSHAETLSHKSEVSNQVQTSGKLCKSCGGEMQRTQVVEKKIKDKGLLGNGKHVLMRSLSNLVPDWLSEPEFMVHAKPKANKDMIHSHADSLFSTSSGFTNYYGILNLCMILLVLGNARLFLENIIKYGILINLSFIEWFFLEPYNWPNLLLTLSICIYPALALATEKLLAGGWISNRTGVVIYCINLGTLLFLPAGIIYYLHPIIVFSLVTLGVATTCFLKLISYAHTNYWCREHNADNKHKRRRSFGGSPGGNKTLNNHNSDQQEYPSNLNVNDMVYFMFAPTLCYELNFPRSARIRKRFLVKRLAEMVFLSWLMVALMQQWIVPAVNNARQPLAEMEIFKMVERLLKLSIPNHLIWLVFFYWLFHSTLNVVAELLRFGDRVFYKDWWNAETVAEFWQNWNIPVHRFASRHVYKPLLRRGVSRLVASTCVFLLSAFFHEYLVSVPLRMFKIWAFTGMLMQVPIAYITGKYIRGKWGNVIMWLSLIVGQPVAILAYFHDYYVVHSLPLHTGNTSTSAGL